MLGVLFWLSVAGLFYIYLGYPLVIGILAALFPRPVRKAPFSGSFSVVIVAHNEGAHLPQKLRGVLESEGVERMKELVVASDGSTDGTADRVREFLRARGPGATGGVSAQPSEEHGKVRLLGFPVRRGKAACLNDAFAECTGEVVVLMDARQRIEPASIKNLLTNFADPRVGAVSGELMLDEGTAGRAAEVGPYWAYEKFIRKCEARFDSVPGATGAFYAIRRALFRPIPPETVLDDVAVPMRAVASGFRCVFESEARAWDSPAATMEAEALRKRRTLAGNVQLVRLFPQWLLPWRNRIWFQFVSHKLLRLTSPFCLVALAASSIALARKPFYAGALFLQVIVYLAAAAGGRKAWRGLRLLRTFVHLNVVTALAVWDGLRGRVTPAWERAQP